MAPQYEPPVLGVRVDLWGQKWYQSKSCPHIPIQLYTHHRPILHRLATIHNAADRQTERWQLATYAIALAT